MRYKIWMAVFGMVVCGVGSGVAHAGTKDGGGGSTIGSSRELVMKELYALRQNALEALDNLGGALPMEAYIETKNRAFGALHDRMQGTKDRDDPDMIYPGFSEGGPAYELLKNKVRFIFVENGPCQDGKKKSDASTRFEMGSDICFSVPRLMKVGSSALRLELIGLVVHELAHQFGGNEDLAVKMQQVYFRRLTSKAIGVPMWQLQTEIRRYKESDPRFDADNRALSFVGIIGNTGKFSGLLRDPLVYESKFKTGYLDYLKRKNPGIVALVTSKHGVKSVEELTVPMIIDRMEDLWQFADGQAVKIGDITLNSSDRLDLLFAYTLLVSGAIWDSNRNFELSL